MGIMDKLTAELLADPVAAAHFAAMPVNLDDTGMAEKVREYALAAATGDTSLRLALEYFIRQAAIAHPDKYWRECAQMEKISTRAFGTRAAAKYQVIARGIERAAASGDYARDSDGRAVFKVDGLTVRCFDSPAAIGLVVAKYRRGLPRGGRTG